MAGKARVHELAKELGVTSKEVLARLNDQGEFVKSASSTVEAPVARRLRESFGGSKPAAGAKGAAKVPDKSLDRALDKAIQKVGGNGEATSAPAKPADRGAAATPAAPPPAAAAEAPAPAAPAPQACAVARTPRGAGPWTADTAAARSTGAAPRCDARPAARPDSEAGSPYPARREQPVLVGAARRPAHPASTPAGSAPRSAQTGRPTTGRRLARQHAAASRRWRRWRIPSGTYRRRRWRRRRPTRRWPAGWSRRRPLRRRWR